MPPVHKLVILLKIAVILVALFPVAAQAGSSNALGYQGRIMRPTGEAANSGTIVFTLKVLDASSNCTLWSETQNVDMTGSLGTFSLAIGAGTRTDGGSHTMRQVFTNAGTLSGLTCATGTTYTPTASEDRNLSVSFNDSGTAVTLASIPIKSAPFALQADQISGYGILNLAKISGAGSANIFTPLQHDFLFNLSAAGNSSSTPCTTGQILKFNGTAWACAADAGGSASNADYTTPGLVQFNTNAATSGVTVASGIATLNTGIAANQIPKLDASANLGVGTATPGSRLDVKGTLRLSGSTSGYVGLAPAAAAGSTTYTLPATDSTGSQYLKSDGAGTLSWGTPGGGGTVNSGTINQLAYYAGAGTAVSGATLAQGATQGVGIGMSSGNITLDTVQDIRTTASPNFAGLLLNNTTTNLTQSVSIGTSYGITWPGNVASTAGSVLTSSTGGLLSWQASVPAANGGTGQSVYTIGDILYASTTTALSKLAASTGGYVLTSNGAGTAPSWQVPVASSVSQLTAATATNTIDNLNFAQIWNWSTATTQSPMTVSANALTTGSLLNLTTSSTSVNSTNGLLNVANTSATTTGTLARFQANSTAASGMTILGSGNVGIGTTAPSAILHTVVTNTTAAALKAESTVNTTGSYSPTGIMVVGANTSTGTINTYRGILISNPTNSGGGTISQAYGLVIAPITSGGTNYAIYSSGGQSYFEDNVGIGTASPRAKLDVSGTLVTKAATLNATSTIDFSTGNTQYTAANCGAFQLNNIKDGGNYMFVVKGATSATCSFTAYSDAGVTSLTVHLPPDHAATTVSKHTVYNMAVVGTDVYIAWTPNY